MARNKVGSNQYKRLVKQSQSVAPRLVIPTTGTARIRCGEMWGTKCQTWVEAPEYRHGAHPSKKAKWAKARDPNAPAEVLATLAWDEYKVMRCGVAGNPHAPAEVLAKLALEEYAYTRWVVAKNPNTPAEALAKLALDKDEHVRQGVANNLNTPAEALSTLALDEDGYVRQAARNNPHLSDHIRAIVALAE